jgi:arginine deiminase
MSVSRVTVNRNIVLDQNHFESAATEFQNLSEDLTRLENRIRELLDELMEGFATPAGARFFQAVNNRLLDPIHDQAIVLEHVSQNLHRARSSYQSVFDQYQALNSSIGTV